MSRPVAVLLLVISTIIWGFAFVAQKTAMETMGPLTFTGVRYILGGIVILPFAVYEYRRRAAEGFAMTRRQWLLTLVLSLGLFLGSWLQQTGLLHTTVTNGGFLTSLYVLFVPLIAFATIRAVPHPIIYFGAPLALIGIYYLNGGRLDQLNIGDAMVTVSAFFWGVQVFLIGIVARETGLPVFVSALSFLVTGVLATAFAFGLETPSLAGIAGGWIEILYAGVLSTSVAYTLQAVGQQYVPPANAAIILSAESLFAAIGGALLLNERLQPIGYFGAALIFLAILLVEAIPAWQERRAVSRT
jgi:drug/metabolite transporter (DMT)-like permease